MKDDSKNENKVPNPDGNPTREKGQVELPSRVPENEKAILGDQQSAEGEQAEHLQKNPDRATEAELGVQAPEEGGEREVA